MIDILKAGRRSDKIIEVGIADEMIADVSLGYKATPDNPNSIIVKIDPRDVSLYRTQPKYRITAIELDGEKIDLDNGRHHLGIILEKE